MPLLHREFRESFMRMPHLKSLFLSLLFVFFNQTLLASEQTPQQRLDIEISNYTKICTTSECAKSMQKMRKFARWKEAKAQLILGYAYLYGDGVEQDTEEAIKWLKRTVFNDNPGAKKFALKATQTLEKMYRQGIGVEQNVAQADEYFSLLVEQGYAPTLYKLALSYEEKDINKSISYLEQASETHYAPAIYRLAQIYQLGYGVTQNDLLAGSYYKQLVVKDYLDSREQLSGIIASLKTNPTPEVTEQLVEFERLLNIEVITVNPDGVVAEDKLSNSLAHFKRSKGKFTPSTGSRIKGRSCGKTSNSCGTIQSDELEDLINEGAGSTDGN